MTGKAPGRCSRKGLTIMELFEMFPDDAAAEKWFEEQRWPDGRFCPRCGSLDTYVVASRRPMPYHCRDCKEYFSVRIGTTMQSEKMGYRKWVIAIYMMTAGPKGTSSMKIHRELGIRQATAWHLMQRIREGFDDGMVVPFQGPVEADETHVGGRERNRYAKDRLRAGRGPAGKVAVACVRDHRPTKQVSASVVARTDADTLQGLLKDGTEDDVTVCTDEAQTHIGIDRKRETVNHSAGEHVRDEAHTRGTDFSWSMSRRCFNGTFNKPSPRHPDRDIQEFAGRHNVRDLDTLFSDDPADRGDCRQASSLSGSDCRQRAVERREGLGRAGCDQ